ncbi:SDR family NAD(P)-dependent oxidoreductase [Pseudoclavibacter terrae]|uniref:SDR family NAD(P)-dependent oxidoreductase n=1 Tax=Pseudoclavibacter terrae TaxID=1530195 RepID=UPI002FDF766E
MQIRGAIALVTGANRGIGEQFVEQLLKQGASKVYATARNPETVTVDDPRVVPLRLDLLDEASISAAAEVASDVTVLVNNAGITTGADLLTAPLAEIRADLETHLFGTLRVIRAFVPALESNGEAAIVNVLSVLSWVATPRGFWLILSRESRGVEHDQRRTR